MPQPDINDSSWNNTIWSLWGLLYKSSWAESERSLQTAISTHYDEVQKLLGRLGPQTGKLKKLAAAWRREADSYGRTIAYGEAAQVLERLEALHKDVTAQLEVDRQLVAAKKKPPAETPKPAPREVAVPTPVASDEEDDDEDSDGLEKFAAFYAKNSSLGHSAQTAKAKPQARPYVPPTSQELWRDAQRTMASDCDSGIGYGAHDVNQESVLRELKLKDGSVAVKQYRSGPENSHKRIMVAGTEQFWTLGLSHQEKRDKGEFSVYRRDGAKSVFTHVSGKKRPEHLAAEAK